jgi:nitrate/nitrite-specific signal transduction histidine kinase
MKKFYWVLCTVMVATGFLSAVVGVPVVLYLKEREKVEPVENMIEAGRKLERGEWCSIAPNPIAYVNCQEVGVKSTQQWQKIYGVLPENGKEH